MIYLDHPSIELSLDLLDPKEEVDENAFHELDFGAIKDIVSDLLKNIPIRENDNRYALEECDDVKGK